MSACGEQDVLASMRAKLGFSSVSMEHFSLVLLYLQCSNPGDLIVLRLEQRLAEIALWPGVQRCQCILRLVFYPSQTIHLLQSDFFAFEYFFVQVLFMHLFCIWSTHHLCRFWFLLLFAKISSFLLNFQ